MLQVVGLFLFFVFLTGLLIWLLSWKYRSLPGLGTPIIGNLYYSLKNLTFSYEGALKKLDAHHDIYGETIAVIYGPVVFVSIADPHVYEELIFHPFMTTKDPLAYESVQDIFEGAFSLSKADKKWKSYRKVIFASLGKKNLKMYHEVFAKRSWELMDALSEQVGEFDIMPYVSLMCMDIVVESLCGLSYQTLKDRNYELATNIMRAQEAYTRAVVTWGIIRLNEKILKTYSALYQFNQKITRDVTESLKYSNFDSDVLNFVENIAAENGTRATQIDYMSKVLLELYFEAQHTIGVCISAALVYLAINTECQEKAWAEQKEIFGDSLRDPTYDDIMGMPYLERVMKETFRISSPPVVAKRADGEIKIGVGTIPKNATVLFYVQRLKKNTEHWKSGIRFDPDHFLPEEVAKRHKHAYFAFSGGLRGCPGSQYAMNCSRVVLSILLRKFKISSPLKQEELSYIPALLAHLSGPHTVSLELRQ